MIFNYKVEQRLGLRCYCWSSSSNKQSTEQPVASTSGANAPAVAGSGSVNTGSQVTLGSNATVQTLDPELIKTALSYLTRSNDQVIQTVGNLTNAQSALAQSVLSADQATAANNSSAGQTNNNKTIAIVAGLALVGIAAVGVFAAKRK